MDKADKKVLMTVFAATALHALLGNFTSRDMVEPKEQASKAFDMAEAMMAEAEKRGHV